jgi:hypothetical protein
VYLITWFLQDNSKIKESAAGGAGGIGTKARPRKGSNAPQSASATKKGNNQEKEQAANQAINEIKMLQ